MLNQSYQPFDFEKCVQSYGNTLFKIVLAMTGNRIEAEDIVQEVTLFQEELHLLSLLNRNTKRSLL